MTARNRFVRPSARALRLPAQALCLAAALTLAGFAQTPNANAPQGRGLGLSTQPAQTQTDARGNSKSTTRPELVLQTGYPLSGATGLTYSPDGKLLATSMGGSNQ